MQSKMVFKICEGTLCSFYVEEFDVIVHKKLFSLYNPIKFLPILYPKSLVNLVVKVGTSQSPDPIWKQGICDNNADL